MNFDLPKLLQYLRVESLGDDHYCGENLPGKRKAVFGGQILAQALSAAIQSTDSERQPHSLHCHFLRGGKVGLPIEFEVVRVRDGGSFSLRQVTALQDGKPMLMATISFQKPESGLQHQQEAPDMVPREAMISEWEYWQQNNTERPELVYMRPDNFTALEILSDFRPGVNNPQPQEPCQHFWFKANGEPDQASDHYLIVAFLSDILLANTALHAHPHTLHHPEVMAASLDHALWFYGDINASQWLYYDMHSPIGGGGRGLNHGYFYTEQGEIVACTSQEGLMRVKGA